VIAPADVPLPCEVTANGDGTYRLTVGAFSVSTSGWPTLAKAKEVLGTTIAEALTRSHANWRPAFARDPAGVLIVACPDLVCGASLWRVTARGAVHLGYELMPPAAALTAGTLVPRNLTPVPDHTNST
jgi:hypothetical protein